MILDTVEVAQGGGEALLIVLLGRCLAYPVCHTVWLNAYSIIWEFPKLFLIFYLSQAICKYSLDINIETIFCGYKIALSPLFIDLKINLNEM